MQIKWASQQSQWDSLVQGANIAVLRIKQILPSIPETTGNAWSHTNPREELASVAYDICSVVKELKVGGKMARCSVQLTA